jgi:acetyl esterase/lipase
MKTHWLAALGGSVALCALAQTTPEPSQQDRVRAMAEAVNRPLVYHVAGEDKVRVQKDRAYRSDPEGKADIYEPPGSRAGAKAPIVIFLHGGVPPAVSFRPKDWGIYQGWGRLMAASGFVAVAFNHRLGFPDPMMAEAADDVEKLVAYVRGHAAEFGADPDRVCVASYSAGGPLLAPFLRQPRPYVRCLAAFYSILDIRDSDNHRRFLKPDQLDLFSPAKQLEEHAAAAPPIFVMRAGRDQVPGLNAWMEKFLDVAIRKNAPITLMIHATGVHGFENTNDDLRSREILKAAIEFMKAQAQR